MLINMCLRSLNLPDVAVLLQSHSVCHSKPNECETSFSQLVLYNYTS